MAQTRSKRGPSSLDPHNYTNWTSAKLIKTLSDAGIRVPTSLRHKQLVDMVASNVYDSSGTNVTSQHGRPVRQLEDAEVVDTLNNITRRVRRQPPPRQPPSSTVTSPPATKDDGTTQVLAELSDLRAKVDKLVRTDRLGSDQTDGDQVLGTTGTARWEVLDRPQANFNIPGTNYTLDSAFNNKETLHANSSDYVDIVVIPLSLKKKIWDGKDVNMALMLNPALDGSLEGTSEGTSSQGQLRPHASLSKPMSLELFLLAFDRYQRVLLEKYAHMKDLEADLKCYVSDIMYMATHYGQNLFYSYHLAFSAKAAAILQQKNIRVRWGRRDHDIFSNLQHGARQACKICHSHEHPTEFCQLGSSQRDIQGREKMRFQDRELCNHYNAEQGCFRVNCRYSHACASCGLLNHPKFRCRRGDRKNSSSGQRNEDKPKPRN